MINFICSSNIEKSLSFFRLALLDHKFSLSAVAMKQLWRIYHFHKTLFQCDVNRSLFYYNTCSINSRISTGSTDIYQFCFFIVNIMLKVRNSGHVTLALGITKHFSAQFTDFECLLVNMQVSPQTRALIKKSFARQVL